MSRSRTETNTYALATAVWAILFAVPSFYWAAGGTFATGTIAADLEGSLGPASEPWVIALTGFGKLLLAAFAVTFAMVPLAKLRHPRMITGYTVAGALVLYGAASLLGHLLMLSGLDAIPASLGRTALYWHTFSAAWCRTMRDKRLPTGLTPCRPSWHRP